MSNSTLYNRLRDFMECEGRSGSMENFWFMVQGVYLEEYIHV